MKITAIADRGMKKDFIDLYFIARKIGSLKKILDQFKKKYNDFSITHYLKGLIYFTDAEKGEKVDMLVDYDWDEIKNYFKQEIKNYQP